jgi:zinc transport system ATP-binding protein
MVSHDIDAALRYASHILHIGGSTFFGTAADYAASPIGRRYLELGGSRG